MNGPRTPIVVAVVAALAAGLLVAAGCSRKGAPTTRPATTADRALRDPGNYSPDFSDTDISNDTAKIDRQGLKQDLRNVIMP